MIADNSQGSPPGRHAKKYITFTKRLFLLDFGQRNTYGAIAPSSMGSDTNTSQFILIERHLIANYIGQGFAAFTALAIVPFYIYYLGIEAYGLIGVFSIAYSLLGVVDSMLQTVITRKMACLSVYSRESSASPRAILLATEIMLLVLATAIASSFWGLSSFLATHWIRAEKIPPYTVANAFSWMGFVISSRLFEALYRACLLGLQRHVVFNALFVLITTARWGGALAVVAFVSPTVTAFFAWQAFAGIFASLLLRFTTRMYLPHQKTTTSLTFDALRQEARFGSGIFAISFLALFLTQIDKVILSKMLTLSDFGYYTLAYSLAVGLAWIVFPIADTCYPRMSEALARNDLRSLSSVFHLGSQLVSVLVGSIAIAMMFFSEPILLLWTHDRTISAKAAPLLQVLLLGQLLNSLYWIPYRVQLAHGWTNLAASLNFLAVLAAVPSIVLVVPIFGAIGAATVWVFLNACYVCIGVHLMFRKIIQRDRSAWYLSDTLKPLFFSTMCTLLIFIFYRESTTPWKNILWILSAWFGGFCAAAMSAACLSERIQSFFSAVFSHGK